MSVTYVQEERSLYILLKSITIQALIIHNR